MFKYDYITRKDIKEQNLNWLQILQTQDLDKKMHSLI